MRSFSAVALLLAVGCASKPPVPVGPAPDAGALYIQAKKAHAVPQTLSADARAFVEAKENGGRYSLHVFVRRPASIRIEALTPTGDPAAVLVADQGRFALLDLRNNVFYRGPATPENLSRLIPAPLRDEELVALITGDIPELPDARPESARRSGDGYQLTLSSLRLRQEVVLGADLRVVQIRRIDARGNLLWAVGMDEHDDSSGAQVPRLIHLDAPLGHTAVDLRLRNTLAGKAPPAGAFQLGVPAGMRVEEVQ
ncbi:MAG TPA: DUF4292 domain-containing protein [Myxococcales bacterium]|jgi:hypothetical protein|nr:DUF4292 domain-containing protein [Myxococcales bacterium]